MASADTEKQFLEAKGEALEWFTGEVASLRSNRVKPNIVESIPVESYGARSPLNSLASVSSIDARTLAISPWDAGTVTDIEKALTNANLGVQPAVDNNIIRLSFPSLTDEVREQTVKTLHSKAEEARIRLRTARDELVKELKKDQDASDITEDDFYDEKNRLDELIAEANKEIEAIIQKKEEELRLV